MLPATKHENTSTTQTRFDLQITENSAPLPTNHLFTYSPSNITDEPVKIENINQCSNAAIDELAKNICNEDISETELYEVKAEIEFDFNNEDELSYNAEVDDIDEKYTIKSETVDTDEEQDVTHNSHFSTFDETNEMKSESDEVLGSQKNDIDESSEVCVDIKHRRKRRNNIPTPLENQSETLPRCKELIVPLEDIMLNKYNKQHFCKKHTAASSTKDNENEYRPSFKDRIVFEKDDILDTLSNSADTFVALEHENTTTDISYVSDPCNVSQTISTRTSNVKSNNLIPNDTESLKKLVICEICDKTFQCKCMLVEHIQKHPKMYNCTYCSYKTFKKQLLKGHINSKHTKSTTFDCSYCNYKSYHRNSLNNHINAKHTNSTIFSCPYCSYKAHLKCNLNQHINHKHTKSTVFNCSDCDYKTYDSTTLKRHINAIHTKSTAFNCSFCDFKTYGKSALRSHINSRHTKSTTYNCSYCNYTCYRKGALNIHINVKHTKSTVFSCSYCDYKAYQRSNLTQHVNSQHTKSTAYNCSYCSYKTYQKRNLDHHTNSQHTKSTVFSCSYCDYTSFDKRAFNRHVSIKHTNSTQFNCSDCNFKTLYKHELSRHVRAKHS